MKTAVKSLIGQIRELDHGVASSEIAWSDHKISFVVKYCRGKNVLDLGCVQHNPANYENKYWVHNAIRSVAKSVVGMDLYQEGVNYLNERGYKIIFADAQDFDLKEKFDVIVAGDIVEHLEDFNGFLLSCKRHMHRESRLLISTPNPWFWRNIAKAGLRRKVSTNAEHTCWLCPVTLKQLLARHDLKIGEIKFGSRYMKERLMPLPKGWKHTSFHLEVMLG